MFPREEAGEAGAEWCGGQADAEVADVVVELAVKLGGLGLSRAVLAVFEDMIRKMERGYRNHTIHGLSQTPEYAKALFENHQPALSPDVVERETAARMSRKAIFDRDPAPTLGFVQEQVTLERPIGGKTVLHRQLEHLLEVARLRNVTLQVMPTEREDQAGMQGLIDVLRFGDGTAVGRSDGALNGRPVSGPRDLQILELRYG